IYTPSFAAAGQLEDITDWAKSLPYFASLSPAHVKTGTYKDHIYGLPFSADASVLIWNKKLFKQAGLDPEKGPTNWAEIEADA
ncbi:MAG: extracellular solute-binding protein, partial [Mesorhizobium sp.]